MSEISSYLQGFVFAGGLIVAIGAQNAFVLKQGLKREAVLPVALVCVGCDVVLMSLGAAGFGSLVTRFPRLAPAATWGGVLFLIAYGLRSLRSAWKTHALEGAPSGPPLSNGAAALAALAFTLLNPHVYLDTVVLLGSIAAQHPPGLRLFFTLGAISVSIIWFFGLGYGAASLAPLFKQPRAWRVLDTFVGIAMLVIAASLVRNATALDGIPETEVSLSS